MTDTKLVDSPRIALHLSNEDHRILRELRTKIERDEDRTVKFSEVVRRALHHYASVKSVVTTA